MLPSKRYLLIWQSVGSAASSLPAQLHSSKYTCPARTVCCAGVHLRKKALHHITLSKAQAAHLKGAGAPCPCPCPECEFFHRTALGVTSMRCHRKFSRASCKDLYRNLKPASWVLDEMTFWPSSTTEAPSPNTDCKQQPQPLLSSCSLCSGGSNSTRRGKLVGQTAQLFVVHQPSTHQPTITEHPPSSHKSTM